MTAGPEPVPDRGHYTEDARLRRLAFARRQSSAPLAALQETRLDATRLAGNIENLIGAVEVPVGIAGPLHFRGPEVHGPVLAPFATSEGALVASATRGAVAISRSGGVTTRAVAQRMTRAPAFAITTVDGAFAFAGLVRDHLHDLRRQIGQVSSHATLVSVEPIVLGRVVHVRFVYETGDAAGQNMTTSCTWHAMRWLIEASRSRPGIDIESSCVEGNMSGDKKVTAQSLAAGRGVRVTAECVIDRRTCERVLKTGPEEFARWHARSAAAAAHTGMIGHNINVANAVAAIYTATGQDIACVHESSLAVLEVGACPEGLVASMTLPGLVVGTVGGGTRLPAQNALLHMMGCAGEGKVFRLAEIIAGFCLALDLSTLAAVVNGQFVSAHERLGRNRPVRPLTVEELDTAFFEPMLRRTTGDTALVADAVTPVDAALGSSIITELSAGGTDRLLGLLPFRVHYRPGTGAGKSLDVIVKVKPLDREVEAMAATMASLCGGPLAVQYHRFLRRTGFAGCHLRELGAYRQTDPRWLRHVPQAYGTVADDERDTHLVVMEHLTDVVLKDTADDVSGWTDDDIDTALRGIAQVHAVWLGREAELLSQNWTGPVLTGADMVEMTPLWSALARHAADEFPDLVDPARWTSLIDAVSLWAPELERMPRTLIHNDFNPRNICLRPTESGLRLCAYDWELATLHVPQHDLAELLCFLLDTDATRARVDRFAEVHRRELERASGVRLARDAWRRGYTLSLYDLAVNRFAQYLMVSTFRDHAFVERSVRTLWHLIGLEEHL